MDPNLLLKENVSHLLETMGIDMDGLVDAVTEQLNVKRVKQEESSKDIIREFGISHNQLKMLLDDWKEKKDDLRRTRVERYRNVMDSLLRALEIISEKQVDDFFTTDMITKISEWMQNNVDNDDKDFPIEILGYLSRFVVDLHNNNQ